MRRGECFVKIVNCPPIHSFFEMFYKTPEYNRFPRFELSKVVSPKQTCNSQTVIENANDCDISGDDEVKKARKELEKRKMEIIERMMMSDGENSYQSFTPKVRKIVESLNTPNNFKKNGSNVECQLDVAYPDESEMRFSLCYDDEINISDNGLTYKYMASHFNVKDVKINRLIKQIISDYSIYEEQTSNGTELRIKINEPENAFISFLWFFSAIERIVNVAV